ncbi:YuzL family protein [Peribacillus deserti]|uniref:YuzL family protein n=1 Tax=Peribacillus deserti TaxID=673318 RepID=A0A2N5MAM3_9BACI|nr:YuzL family protein [Peribacillus deserti]PLT31409.1 YuzL family protein [Peribacillus deserti]
MNKIKQDASTAGLSSSKVKGQGTTNQETGSIEMGSSRKKQKTHSK